MPITVVGMGKVALGKMSPLSDLDLIFVFDQQETSLELASRFVSRLQTAISTPMREGILYELDTRLRPSGRSGAPTVSIESFANHHLQRAHTWEHIALVPSRVVAGNRAPEARLNEIKAQLVKQNRDPRQLINDSQKMWARIAEHRVKPIGPELMFSKLRRGGLMQAEYLASCLILDAGHNLSVSSVELVGCEIVKREFIDGSMYALAEYKLDGEMRKLIKSQVEKALTSKQALLSEFRAKQGFEALDKELVKLEGTLP